MNWLSLIALLVIFVYYLVLVVFRPKPEERPKVQIPKSSPVQPPEPPKKRVEEKPAVIKKPEIYKKTIKNKKDLIIYSEIVNRKF